MIFCIPLVVFVPLSPSEHVPLFLSHLWHAVSFLVVHCSVYDLLISGPIQS